MNLTRFLFQPILSITTTVVTACAIVAPSQAADIIFSSPGVLAGINGVSFTLPSTGVSNIYNITLERGTVTSVFGTPPKFDLLNQIDAGDAINQSVQGINLFLSRTGATELWFESVGTKVFYLPYEIDRNSGLVKTSRNRYATTAEASFIDILPEENVVYARLHPVSVPEPSTFLDILVVGALGTVLKGKRKLSKSTEKEMELEGFVTNRART
ncbi:hypothetical protein [Microseira sp. BLCC-F43]|jgi:hypothetical protein|uniref:hypothetical protein n=1 Tax=Microseira sp. BLCC-F43 TaxID=3153602 RepID=UPI0035B77175